MAEQCGQTRGDTPRKPEQALQTVRDQREQVIKDCAAE
jgi:hypothetical protein